MDERGRGSWFFLGMLALAVGLVMAGRAVRDGLASRSERDTIVVAGSARRPVEADRVSWELHLTSRQPSPDRANAELSGWLTRVNRFLTDGGITPDELTATPVSLDRLVNTDNSGNETFVAWLATRSVRVDSTRLDVVDRIANHSDALIAGGIPVQTGSPDFIYTKLAGNRAAMVAQAGEDAKRRAARLVKVGGAKLGRVRNVQVGDFQVTARSGTDFESGGPFDRSSRHKDIVVVVHLTFELR